MCPKLSCEDTQRKERTELCCSLEISIVIFAIGLQDDGDDCHDGFDNTELESRLESTL